LNYINGKFVVEPFSEGILYGNGVFETILVEEGTGSNLEEHYNRLLKGTEVLGISFEQPYRVFKKHVDKFIERSHKKRYALRVSVVKKGYTYDFLISERDIPYGEEDYKRGFSLKVGSVLKNPTSPMTYIKSICYMENLLSLREARSEGYNEIIYLNFDGKICEGAISNIFFVKNGVVKTPKAACGLLEGTMRAEVIERLKSLEVEVEEGSYTLEELMEAEEVFLTNSLMEIMPVGDIEGSKKNARYIYKLLKNN